MPYLLLPGAGVRRRDDEIRVVRKFDQRIARVNCLQVGCRDGIRCRSDARPLNDTGRYAGCGRLFTVERSGVDIQGAYAPLSKVQKFLYLISELFMPVYVLQPT